MILRLTCLCALLIACETQNIPLMIAGSASGRLKTGQHIAGGASPNARVALTLQQAFGVPIGEWGVDENATSSPVSDLLA